MKLDLTSSFRLLAIATLQIHIHIICSFLLPKDFCLLCIARFYRSQLRCFFARSYHDSPRGQIHLLGARTKLLPHVASLSFLPWYQFAGVIVLNYRRQSLTSLLILPKNTAPPVRVHGTEWAPGIRRTPGITGYHCPILNSAMI